MDSIAIISLVVGMLLGATGAYIYLKNKLSLAQDIPEEELERIVEKKRAAELAKAKQEALKISTEAEQKALDIIAEAEASVKALRKEINDQQALLVEREKTLNERSKQLDERNDELEAAIEENKERHKQLAKLQSELEGKLEEISGLTRDEARKRLEEEVKAGLVDYEAKLIREAVQKAQKQSDEKAKQILVESMQRVVTDYVGETTTTTVKVDDEKIKGRIIGKGGRNIRAFEKATGVDVNIDEAPDAIALSSFDPLRREIARVALEKLLKLTGIHPASIEDEIRKAKNEVALAIKENGEILADEAGWPGMDLGLIKLIGKMKYRTSYGQSLMSHTIEVIRIGATIASELGADVALVKKACLLHDVGKVLTHKVEGAHHHISGQIARKYGLDEKLVNAIEAHHLDIEPQSIEAVIVHLADAISGARPGARRDSHEHFVERMQALEKAAKDVAGDKAKEVYAIKAGREMRIIVEPAKITDNEITVLAKDIADKVQESQAYPGTIDIIVIRENRAKALAT